MAPSSSTGAIVMGLEEGKYKEAVAQDRSLVNKEDEEHGLGGRKMELFRVGKYNCPEEFKGWRCGLDRGYVNSNVFKLS